MHDGINGLTLKRLPRSLHELLYRIAGQVSSSMFSLAVGARIQTPRPAEMRTERKDLKRGTRMDTFTDVLEAVAYDTVCGIDRCLLLDSISFSSVLLMTLIIYNPSKSKVANLNCK